MSAGLEFQGACLYVPAVHPKLQEVLSGSVPSLRVAVVDLEDSVSLYRLPEAIEVVRHLPCSLETTHPRVYVRPRTPEQLLELIQCGGSRRWCGYVLPKLNTATVGRWLKPLEGTEERVMPILETADSFCPNALRDLCDALVEGPVAGKIDAVRLGGTDLFSLMGSRRPRGRTIYESVLGPTICGIACYLMSRKLPVTSPVCEVIRPDRVMEDEVRRDVESGFIGKTAISPMQVALINAEFAVSSQDLLEARTILGSNVAVFESRGAMCEASPHSAWATRVMLRHAAFGLKEERTDSIRSAVPSELGFEISQS